jgi:hypothetical protein
VNTYERMWIYQTRAPSGRLIQDSLTSIAGAYVRAFGGSRSHARKTLKQMGFAAECQSWELTFQLPEVQFDAQGNEL